VTPDISLPTMTDVEDFGESSYDNALPWTQIKAADYTPTGDLTGIVPKLVAIHEARISADKDFGYLREDIVEFNAQRKKNLISLNETDRRKEREAQEAKIKLREKDGAADKGAKSTRVQDDGLQSNERNLNDELAIEKARKEAKDIFLNEAAHILSDEAGLLQASPRLSVRVLPKLE
jgi:carboxyl-terminal processing protease